MTITVFRMFKMKMSKWQDGIKWTLQLYLLNLTKGAKFAGSIGHLMTKMLSAPEPRWGLCPETPIIGSALTMVSPQLLTPSAVYESNWILPRYLKPKVGAYVNTHCCTQFSAALTIFASCNFQPLKQFSEALGGWIFQPH